MKNRLLAVLSLSVASSLACSKSSPPVITTFTASPASITAGQSATLAWVVTGATTLTLSPTVGPVTGTNVSVAPTATTTYTLEAEGSGKTTATATVTVTPRITPAKIVSFVVSPAQVASGAAVTLTWNVTDAITVSIDDGTGPVAQTAGTTTLTTHPTATTTYTLIVTGAAGTTAPAPAIGTVRVGAAPTLTFNADKLDISQGEHATLTWSGTARSYSVSDGTTTTALGPLLSLVVHPALATTYTLTGTSAAATATATRTLTINVTQRLGVALVYTDPVTPTGQVALMKDAASTPTKLVLKLVTLQMVIASALALNLPLDSSKVSIDTTAGNAGPGLTVNAAALNPGSPPAAKAVLGNGPLQDVLVIGVAQRPALGDKTIPSGIELARITLDLVAAGGKGIVFDGTALPANYRALIRGSTTTPDGASSTFAIGKLEVQ